MLINSAGYKVLTSVDQYLELVNSSLPGEWSWWLRGEEECLGSPAPQCCRASLGTFGKGWFWDLGIPGEPQEGMGLGCGHLCGLLGRDGFGMWPSLWTFGKGCFGVWASLGTFWKGWFWSVGIRGDLQEGVVLGCGL